MGNTTSSTGCTTLWQDIVIAIVTTIFYLLVMVITYGKICRKIDKLSDIYKARRQPGFKPKNPSTAPSEKESGPEKMRTCQQELARWLSEQAQAQQSQVSNIQINSGIAGSSSEISQRSCTRQHSGSDDVNYTTLVFQPPTYDSTDGDHEDTSVKEHYENVIR